MLFGSLVYGLYFLARAMRHPALIALFCLFASALAVGWFEYYYWHDFFFTCLA